MTEQAIVELGRSTLTVAAMLVGPLLLVALLVGLLASVLQTITSIQEQTLTFVPKVAAVLAAVAILMPWLLRTICQFTTTLLTNLGGLGS